ncbi:MAG: nucleotidyltransferase family protein [Rhodospirillaceae bacterium]|nr:nucleotidyltransferase family protein [Rhodospirillaceae bacterium]
MLRAKRKSIFSIPRQTRTCWPRRPAVSTDRDFLERCVRASPLAGPVLERWADVRLPDAWLVAGAVTQTVWNVNSGLPPEHGIRDMDIVYFDGADLSAEAEAAEEERIRTLFSDIPIKADVKNQARVHLWYEDRFGIVIPPYTSTDDAIATFPTTATAVGVRKDGAQFEVTAPFGLADLCAMLVRPNKAQVSAEIYEAKVARWRELWPALDIQPWNG